MAGTFNIYAEGPYSFNESLVFLNRSDKECLFSVKDNVVSRVIEFSGEPVFFSVSGIDGGVRVSHNTDKYEEELEEYVIQWLDLHKNLDAIYSLAEKDRFIAPLIKKYHGARLTCIPDLFEGFFWAISGQNISLHVVYTIKKLMVETYGNKYEYNGDTYYTFPSAEVCNKLTVENLLKLKLSTSKAVCIKEIAERVVSGELSRENLMDLGCKKNIIAELKKIKGIGDWTANYILMRSLHYTNALPAGDAGLLNALKNILGSDKKPTNKEVMDYALNWKGWETYATFYLWRSLYD